MVTMGEPSYSEQMIISTRGIHGFMPNSHKKSQVYFHSFPSNFLVPISKDYLIFIQQMLSYNINAIEVRAEKASEFRKQMDVWSLTRNFTGACRSWYKNKDGINFILWPSNLLHYWWITNKTSLLENYWLTLENPKKRKIA